MALCYAATVFSTRRLLFALFFAKTASLLAQQSAPPVDQQKRQQFLKAREEMHAVPPPSKSKSKAAPKPKAGRPDSDASEPAPRKKPKAQSASESSKTKPKPTSKPKPDPEPETPAPRPKSKPDPEPETPAPRPKPKPDPEPETPAPRPKPKPDPEPEAPPAPRPKPKPEPAPEAVAPRPKPVPEPEKAEPAPRQKPIPAPAPPPDPIVFAPVTVEKSGFEAGRGLQPVPSPGWFTRWNYLPKDLRKRIDNAPVLKHRWRYVVVHNSGTRQGNAKAFEYYHLHVRKMPNGLAYQFVIGNGTSSGDGEIEVGSRWTRQINGGHVHSDYLNNIALGICLVGDLNQDVPTAKQLAALEELIRYLRLRVGQIDHKFAAVKAHREINPPRWPTDCPGTEFPYDWLHGKFR